MTGRQIGDQVFWSITPKSRHRVGARWHASAAELSSTRRALGRLKREGAVVVIGRRWRKYVYDAVRPPGE